MNLFEKIGIGISVLVVIAYIYQIAKDFQAHRSRGGFFVSFKREMNAHLILGELFLVFVLFIGEQIWEHNNQQFLLIYSIVLYSVFMIDCFRRGLKKEAIYENMIITREKMYALTDVKSYEYRDIMEDEGVVALRITVQGKSILGKIKIKEMQFKLEKDKMDEIEPLFIKLFPNCETNE